MKNWNKKIGLAILSFGLLSFAPSAASAQGYYGNGSCVDPCADCCGLGGLEFGVDFLWWQPSQDGLAFGAEWTDVDLDSAAYKVVAKTKCLKAKWEPGFRIYASKESCWCDWNLKASFARVSYSRSGDVQATDGENATIVFSPFLFPAFAGDFKFVNGSFKTSYNEWDLLVSKDFSSNCCATFTPFAGLAGLYIDQKVKTTSYTSIVDGKIQDAGSASTRWTNHFWGVGLKAGSDLQVQIFDCIKFIGSGSATILAGEDDPKNFQKAISNASGNPERSIAQEGNENCVHIIPGYHIAAGFSYETETCGWNLGFRLGYEFVQWWNIARAPVLDDSTTSRSGSFGFHGLFAGADVKF